MPNKKKYTVTAALPYANGPLHIGHMAGAYLPADIYVRFLRLMKKEVLFVCGSDENGAAITLKAFEEKTTPKKIIDQFHKTNKNIFEDFGISFDIYHRTSAKLHHKTAQDFFLELHKRGVFETRESLQFYDDSANFFLADRYMMGTCPNCQFEKAYGDQCESCGSSLSLQDLINPVSRLTGKAPIKRRTKHWYLNLGAHQSWLEEWIEKGLYQEELHHDPKAWKSHVLGQCHSWLKAGLSARAMTRDLDWGVDVPLTKAEGKKLYVWLDAPIGYISATKEWAKQKGKNWQDYWQDPNTELVHFIGKDNIVFHCIIFPILLHTHGNFILPTNVPANSFLNLEGQKISTSRNWAVWLTDYLKDFKNKQDELRYYLISILPENRDSEFTWKGFQERNNNELLAVLGNFFNRCMVLIHKYFNGEVPASQNQISEDIALYQYILEQSKRIEKHLWAFQFKEGMIEVMNLVRAGNKYLTETAPWQLVKIDKERAGMVLYMAVQLCASVAILIRPFLPETAKKMSDILNFSSESWKDCYEFPLLPPMHTIKKAKVLFEKIEDIAVEKQIQKLKQTTDEQETATSNIGFSDFQKLVLKVGTILSAKRVPKTDKLLEFQIDIGEAKARTIISGIAEQYSPDQLVNEQVIVLSNLEPKKMRGKLSQGMILLAEDNSGKLIFVSPEQKVKNGSVVA